MGGLVGVRRGRTAGDLTGGGGRSVEAVRRGGDPRRSGLSRVFGRYYGPQEREVPAGGWEPPPPGGGYSGGVIPRFQGGGRTMNPRAAGAAGLRRRFPRGAMRLMPGQPGVSEDDPRLQWQEIQGPGGGYSGGVIPRFQSGGAPRRTGALHGSIIGDPSSGQWTEHFPAIGQNPIYSGWGRVTKRPGVTIRSFNNQNLPYPNRPPGGGYSGGVIPRFQSGDRIRPRFDQFGNRRPVKIRNPNRLGDPWLLEHWQNTNAARRATVAAARRANQAQQQASRSPGGWQAGGQFPEPSFPVENQLSDESSWYPDEEVGYEEAAPMQGGFDIFGRGGG